MHGLLIKETREKLGYTQKVLAEKTGLSLRTIQRLEVSKNAPKGYTLTQLAKVFEMTPRSLQEKFQAIDPRQADRTSIKLIYQKERGRKNRWCQ